jgi:hypothetical protein
MILGCSFLSHKRERGREGERERGWLSDGDSPSCLQGAVA